MDKQLRLDPDKVYTSKEVSAFTGYNANTLRRKCLHYKIEAPLTNGGHRRFTKQNVEMLIAIKEKEDSGWTQDRVDEWLKGEGAPLDFDEYVPKSVDEMRMERIESENRELREENEQVKEAIQLISKKMDEQTEFFMKMFEKQQEENQKQIKKLLNEHIEKRDHLLMTTIRESQRESQQTIKETAASIEQLANYQEQMNKKPKTLRDRIAHWFGSSK